MDIDLSSWDAVKAENLEACSLCGLPIEPGQWICGTLPVQHHHCPTQRKVIGEG